MIGRLVHVSKVYGRRDVLTNIGLSVNRGEILGLIGANGAGKTTLLRVFAGLLRPTAGEIRYDDPSSSEPVRYFGGEHSLPPTLTPHAWLSFWKARNSGAASRRSFRVLSRGMRQRVGLEGVLTAEQPRLLLLDEPWEGLDPDASRWLSNVLLEQRRRGAGIVVSSHRIHDLASVADRCVFLIGGSLAIHSVDCASLPTQEARSACLFEMFDRSRGCR